MCFSIPCRSTFITLTQNKSGPPRSQAAAHRCLPPSPVTWAWPWDPYSGGENQLVSFDLHTRHGTCSRNRDTWSFLVSQSRTSCSAEMHVPIATCEMEPATKHHELSCVVGSHSLSHGRQDREASPSHCCQLELPVQALPAHCIAGLEHLLMQTKKGYRYTGKIDSDGTKPLTMC